MREHDNESDVDDASEDAATNVVPDGGLTQDEVMAREMVTYIAGYLVDDRDAIDVGTEWDGDRLKVILKVADEDKGKVIGRNGRVVRAMQSLLRVSAVKSNIRANLDVI